jgi:hypothetical protein
MQTKTTTRRAVLAGIATAPALAAPALALTSAGPDPIYAAIEAHPRLMAKMFEAWRRLDEAEGDTEERRPCPLVAWRNYSHIGGSEIERAREEFLELPGVDPKKIEQEYRSAKAREKAKQQNLRDWYKRNGMADLKAEADRAGEAESAALLAVFTTRPTTVAGMAALLDYAAAQSGQYAKDHGTYIFDRTDEAVSKAGEDFYQHLAESLRAIGAAS